VICDVVGPIPSVAMLGNKILLPVPVTSMPAHYMKNTPTLYRQCSHNKQQLVPCKLQAAQCTYTYRPTFLTEFYTLLKYNSRLIGLHNAPYIITGFVVPGRTTSD
jgi:hypothetical protein